MRTATPLALLALLLLRAGGAAAAPPDTLVDNGVRAIIGCHDGVATVRGSGNSVTVDGRCTSLRVSGSDNVVTAELAVGGIVAIEGNHNRIVYLGAVAPEAQTRGFYDEIVRAEPAPLPGLVAATPPPVLLLDPTSPSFDVSCQNRDVVIRGDAQRYVLRGGCRSVAIEGRLNTVTAELLPGAPISIGGAGVLVNYVLVGEGPAPVVRVTAPGLRAEQIEHYDNSQLSLPTYR